MEIDILTWSRSVLETTPSRWNVLCSNLPHDLLQRSPAPGEWSAMECLLHLVDAERGVFPARVDYLLAEQDFPTFDPSIQGTPLTADTDPSELAAEFERLRKESLPLFDRISTSDLKRQARHLELGMVTLSELLHEWAAHDLMHTVQAERALMQPLIAGSGAWKVYFSDHSVD